GSRRPHRGHVPVPGERDAAALVLVERFLKQMNIRARAASPADPAPPKCRDRKSTRLNSSHVEISYAVFCLKKQTRVPHRGHAGTPPPHPTNNTWTRPMA